MVVGGEGLVDCTTNISWPLHILLDLDEDLHVREAPDQTLGERQFQVSGDGLGQGPAGIAGDDLDRRLHACGLNIWGLGPRHVLNT